MTPTITMWSCHLQQWHRGIPAARDLGELDRADRARVSRHLTNHGH